MFCWKQWMGFILKIKPQKEKIKELTGSREVLAKYKAKTIKKNNIFEKKKLQFSLYLKHYK